MLIGEVTLSASRTHLTTLYTVASDNATLSRRVTELVGREEIRGWGERVPALVDYFVQTTHPGVISLDGDTAIGRAYMSELIGLRDGRSELNYAIYHDRYQRTPDGWKFTERVYEVRYHDTSPLAGSAPHAAPRSMREA